MKRYYLLRNNQESGPFLIRELKEMPLYTTDLIWVEGEKHPWRFPAELPELALVAIVPPKPAKTTGSFNTYTGSAPDALFSSDSITDSSLTAPSFEALRLKYAEEKSPKRKLVLANNAVSNVFGVIVLATGLLLTGFMMKKAVENIDWQPMVATAESIEIDRASLPLSTTVNTAKRNIVQAEEPTIIPAKNAEQTFSAKAVDVRKTGAAKTATMPPVVEKILVPPVVAFTGDATLPPVEGPGQTPTEKPAAEKSGTSEDSEPANPKPDVVKPALQLTASAYKVGLLGGISDLQLSVNNPTAQVVNKAVITIEYLKPNGKTVGTKTLEVAALGPGASRTVEVPDHSRGVSVRYKTTNIER